MTHRTTTEWIRRSVLRSAGLEYPTIEEVRTTTADKRDPHFNQLRDARLLMGTLRYELNGLNPDFQPIPRAWHALWDYLTTRNREALVDLANCAELEWQRPSFDRTYFAATERGGWSWRAWIGRILWRILWWVTSRAWK